MGVQGRRNLVKTGWARPQILTTSTIGISKLDKFCNLDGFFASDLKKTGWANAYPAHPVAPPLVCIYKTPKLKVPLKRFALKTSETCFV